MSEYALVLGGRKAGLTGWLGSAWQRRSSEACGHGVVRDFTSKCDGCFATKTYALVWYGWYGHWKPAFKGGQDKKVIDNLVVNCLQQVTVNQFFRSGDWRLIFTGDHLLYLYKYVSLLILFTHCAVIKLLSFLCVTSVPPYLSAEALQVWRRVALHWSTAHGYNIFSSHSPVWCSNVSWLWLLLQGLGVMGILDFVCRRLRIPTRLTGAV